MIDFIIVIAYFGIVLFLALRSRTKEAELNTESYFLSNRNLKWYSVAISTIATNVQGYQFLGMMGSAYLYGLAQANLEINAVQGLLLAAFVFVPLYLKDKVVTITQFIQKKLGNEVGLLYSLANLTILSTLGLGAALFWGAYAAELIFSDYLMWIHPDKIYRICIMVVFLGVFSATYTYLGGLAAVVRTDIVQFGILVLGGGLLLYFSVKEIGGLSALYKLKPEMMHLHLPSDHEKLPWTLIWGLFFLNINYWCANQSVVQRSLAAKNLRHAQTGLLVGGVMKYFMAVLIIIPGIALSVLLQENGLSDPDETFPYLVNQFLGPGIKGFIVCALFASLMSTVDSTFNSLATLFSIDIYKPYINPDANEYEIVSAGRNTILVSLLLGVLMGVILVYFKFNNPESAFTHTLNELRYYINCGVVVVICSTALTLSPNKWLVIGAMLLTVPLQLILKSGFENMNYFVRAGWVIALPLLIILSITMFKKQLRSLNTLFVSSSKFNTRFGILLLISLLCLHLIFH